LHDRRNYLNPHSYASEQHLSRLFRKSPLELIELADNHTRSVQAWLASRSPQAVSFTTCGGIQIASTGIGVRLLNLALGCNFPPEMDEKTILNEIGEVKAFFEDRAVPWLWWMGPNSNPANPRPHLRRCGLSYTPHPLPSMIVPLSTPPSFPAIRDEIDVWRARTRADLQAASKIRHAAFRFPAGEGLMYFEDMASSWLSPASPATLYLAGNSRDALAAIGAVVVGAEIPGIYIMATLPEYGRQGFGKVILARLLRHIRQHQPDTEIAVLTASKYGFPLYAQFGFEYLFDYDIYAMETGN
jgi:GNAT superfamily N-acetyltransferase